MTAVDDGSRYRLHRHYYVLGDDVTVSRIECRFDLVTCIACSSTSPDHRAAFAGMLDLLRPGAHVVITVRYDEHRFVEDVYRLPGAGTARTFRS